MDSELMSCPTCSHTVSNAAGACTYCGAMMVKNKQQPQAENKVIGQTAPMPESPPPLPPVQSRPAGEMPEVAVLDAESSVSQPASDSLATADLPATAETQDPTPAADPESEIELLYFEDEPEDTVPVDEQVSEFVPETDQSAPDFEIAAETAPAEAVEAESVADATAVTQPKTQEPAAAAIPVVENNNPPAQQEDAAPAATGDVMPPPEAEMLDTAGDDTGNPGKVEEAKVEQIKAEAAQQEPEAPEPNEKSAASAEPVENVQTKPEKELQPKNATVIDIKTGEVPKSTGETIYLDLSTEVAPAANEPPAANSVAAEPKPTAQTQNVNKPTAADTTKANALKQQKVALAKAQALKKQKLVQARAAALKRKKAAQAKALAAGAAAKSQKPAAPPVSPKPVVGAGADLRMHTLLEKYKGRVIGINYDNSADIRGAKLVQVNAEFFSVFVKDKGLRYSYPISAILTVIESKDGVDIDNAKQVDKFIAVFKLHPLVLF